MKSQINFRQHFVLLLSLLFLGTAAFAQSGRNESKVDSTVIILKNKQIIIISDEDGKRVEVKEKKNDQDIITSDEGDVIIIEESNGEHEEAYEYDEDEQEYMEEREYDNDEEDYDYAHKKKKRGNSSDVDLIAFDLGLTNYFANGQYGVNAIPGNNLLALNELRPGSHVAVHFFPTTASLIGRGAVNLKTALTLDYTNLYFANNVVIDDRGEQLILTESSTNFSTNKLTARYVQIPLLLNINTDPGGKDGVSISFGVYGGMLWKAWTKQVFEENGQKKVDKVAGTYNLNPFKVGLMGRLDFKWFDIYAMYNISPLFENGQFPETQTIVAGVNFLNF